MLNAWSEGKRKKKEQKQDGENDRNTNQQQIRTTLIPNLYNIHVCAFSQGREDALKSGFVWPFSSTL